MAYRYAVLLETTNGSGRPVGVAIEHAAGVLVDLPKEHGVPVTYEGEYVVLQPDMTEVVYGPGDTGYLDQVLGDLSWGFAIGEVGDLDALTPSSFARLRARVLADSVRQRTGTYETRGAHGDVAGTRVAAYAADDEEIAVVAHAARDDLALVA